MKYNHSHRVNDERMRFFLNFSQTPTDHAMNLCMSDGERMVHYRQKEVDRFYLCMLLKKKIIIIIKNVMLKLSNGTTLKFVLMLK